MSHVAPGLLSTQARNFSAPSFRRQQSVEADPAASGGSTPVPLAEATPSSSSPAFVAPSFRRMASAEMDPSAIANGGIAAVDALKKGSTFVTSTSSNISVSTYRSSGKSQQRLVYTGFRSDGRTSAAANPLFAAQLPNAQQLQELMEQPDVREAEYLRFLTERRRSSIRSLGMIGFWFLILVALLDFRDSEWSPSAELVALRTLSVLLFVALVAYVSSPLFTQRAVLSTLVVWGSVFYSTLATTLSYGVDDYSNMLSFQAQSGKITIHYLLYHYSGLWSTGVAIAASIDYVVYLSMVLVLVDNGAGTLELARSTIIIPVAILINTWAARVAEYEMRETFHSRSTLKRERERTEQILDDMLPSNIAAELREDPNRIVAKSFRNVSIMFCTVVDFNRLSMEVPPSELFQVIHRLYSEFDMLADHYGTHKIEVVGGTWMGAVGMTGSSNPALEVGILHLANAMISVAKGFTTPWGVGLPIRIGIHTGHVVGGVIGIKIPLFKLIADSVNTASRYQSTGLPMMCQVSGETRAYFQDFFEFKERGKILAKGKGSLQAFFLQGPIEKRASKQAASSPTQTPPASPAIEPSRPPVSELKIESTLDRMEGLLVSARDSVSSLLRRKPSAYDEASAAGVGGLQDVGSSDSQTSASRQSQGAGGSSAPEIKAVVEDEMDADAPVDLADAPAPAPAPLPDGERSFYTPGTVPPDSGSPESSKALLQTTGGTLSDEWMEMFWDKDTGKQATKDQMSPLTLQYVDAETERLFVDETCQGNMDRQRITLLFYGLVLVVLFEVQATEVPPGDRLAVGFVRVGAIGTILLLIAVSHWIVRVEAFLVGLAVVGALQTTEVVFFAETVALVKLVHYMVVMVAIRAPIKYSGLLCAADFGVFVAVVMAEDLESEVGAWLQTSIRVLVALLFLGFASWTSEQRKRAQFLIRLDLEAERQHGEQLLLAMLPPPVMERLKRGDPYVFEAFGEVTVLVSDIVGFTSMASRMRPRQLVAFLNALFSTFDKLTDRFGSFKIATVGDSYVAAAGMPVYRADHAATIVEMAREMLRAIAKVQRKTGIEFQMRIGVGSGRAAGGVLGLRKHQYVIWGETAILAEAMEANGVPGRVLIAAETYSYVKDRFRVRPHTVKLANGKELEAYIVLGDDEPIDTTAGPGDTAADASASPPTAESPRQREPTSARRPSMVASELVRGAREAIRRSFAHAAVLQVAIPENNEEDGTPLSPMRSPSPSALRRTPTMDVLLEDATEE